MIQIAAQTRILVAVEAVDFRKGIDGLARVCQERLQSDPFCGWLFVFRNRRQTSLKILAYNARSASRADASLSGQQVRRRRQEFWRLTSSTAGGDPASARGAPVWRQVTAPS
jgi:transposase